MDKFDFDHIVDRHNSDCYKWDLFPELLPLWVADMDFAVAPSIIDALKKRLAHPVFGYSMITSSWRKAYVDFFDRRYDFHFEAEDLLFVTGVVPALSSSVRALTEIGDEVIVFPPVYNVFYNSIRNSGRVVKEVPLINENGTYVFDFDAIEAAFAGKNAKLCFLCNPGNPVSRIWSNDEMARLAKLAKTHGVIILSDEIHCLITRPGTKYHPFLECCPEAREIGFVALSVTKGFNLAGIQTAVIIAPNKEIRSKAERQINTDEVAEPNSFALIAAEAALNEGESWLDQMNEYVFSNRDFAVNYINEHIPSLHPLEGDATYLLWVDVSDAEEEISSFYEYLKEEEHLLFNDGKVYGEGGAHYLRINLATSREVLAEALRRLEHGERTYKSRKVIH